MAWCCLLLAACTPAPMPKYVSDEAHAGVLPAEVELPARLREPGRHDFEVPLDGGRTGSVTVSVPDAPDPGAVVVFLHGALPRVLAKLPDPREHTRHLLTCLVEPGLRALNPVIIAPRNEHGRWWEASEAELVLGLAVAARRLWPAASRRMVIAGYSNGALATWYFARLYPQHFVAAIPIASNESVIGETPLPVYAIHGTKDELFPLVPVRAAIDRLRARRGRVTLREKYRGTHLKPCSYAPELRDAADWLEARALAGRHPSADGS